ncbi:MAG: hypothetical protein ACSHX9_01585 [Luteolibacter sp.]
MNAFFEFNGRGANGIAHDKILQLDPNDGAVFLITTRIGKVEFVMAYCRAAIIEKWGCYTMNAFVRASSSDLCRTWAVPVASDLMIYHAVSIYLVPDEPWMTVTV